MIIAMIHPSGICHTIVENPKIIDEVQIPENGTQIPDYDYAYLNSHYSKDSGEWVFRPTKQFVWNDEENAFVQIGKELVEDAEEVAEETQTEE